MRSARIIGTGIAAMCCAKLLLDKGWTVSVREPARAPAPALVLNPVTIQLIELIFGDTGRLFSDAHLLNARVVRWGQSTVDSCTPVFALTLAGNVLGERLWAGLKDRVSEEDTRPGENDQSSGGWTIYASRTAEITADRLSLTPGSVGRRCALISTVELRDSVDTSQHWIESTSEGWLFLAPLDSYLATLQVVVPRQPINPSEMLSRVLAKSTLIGDLIREPRGPVEVFNCAPGRLTQITGQRWLAAGSAATSYDPLCGDGTGYAIRGGILAAALLEALEQPAAQADYVGYYAARLNDAFYAHLKACYSFYSTAGFNHTWQAEIKKTEAAMRLLGQRMIRPASFRCSLSGLELIHYDATKESEPGAPNYSSPDNPPERKSVAQVSLEPTSRDPDIE